MRRPATRLLAVASLSTSLLVTAAAGPVAAVAPARDHGPFPSVVALPDGFQPEGLTSGPGTTAYVGSLRDGAIWSGDLRTGEGGILVPGQEGQVAVGTEYDPATGRLWVAGGATGEVRVYDAASGALLRTWTPGGTGFVNDVTVTPDAAYLTDSRAEALVVVPTPDGSLDAEAVLLPITGDLELTEGFNANGIVDAGGTLLLAQSSTGLLFTVDPDTGQSRAVDLGGARLTNADGLYLRGRTLFVVRNQDELVVRVQLRGDLRSGSVRAELTTDDLDVPTTVTVAAGRIYVVNARFGTTPTPTLGYDIVRVPSR